jgi:energy-coupling factor transporter ATP-binding protein EcfA2
MLEPITIQYTFRPVRRSLATGHVADLFGLSEQEPAHAVAENVALDVRPGDLVLFTGPSGSGKSSLLRASANQLGALDAFALPLPDVPLIDALPGPVDERLATLAGCGLSEARLLLRTPAELSEGQRYRFLLAWAFARANVHRSQRSEVRGQESQERGSGLTSDLCPLTSAVVADEFTATLDRTLAKVVAFNVRKLVSRTGVGLLAATTHEDIVEDLQPDLWVRCGEGWIEAERRGWKSRRVSFADELWMSDGTRSDWAYFARWHYRGDRLAFLRRVMLLWHDREPVGICVFGAPAASLSARTRFFDLHDPRSSVALSALNQQLWLLQRVVLHPTYRGAGVAAAFVRRACELSPVDWIEALSAMGQTNPFFERAGFTRVGTIGRTSRARTGLAQFAGATARVSSQTRAKSHFSNPVYYVFDNRRR